MSSKGRTSGFDPGNEGSNPSMPSRKFNFKRGQTMAIDNFILEDINRVIEQYNLYFQRKLGSIPGIHRKSNKDHYCFIPSRNVVEITNVLYKAKEQLCTSPLKHTLPLKFLDCGCGIGNIMLIAEAVGYKTYGIEYEEATCKVARDLTWKPRTVRGNNKNNSIICGDIATFKHYADYDVIYYYKPIEEYNKGRQFYKKLADNVRIGNIVISYGGSDHFRDDVRFRTLPGVHACWIYQKIAK